jgi:hypothetical protein
MNPWVALASIAVPFAVGCALVRVLGLSWREDGLAATGYAYVAGTFATGLVMLAWLFAGLPLAAVPFNAVLAGIALGLALLGRHRPRPAEPSLLPESPWDRSPRWQRIVFGIVVTAMIAVVCDRALLTNLRPVMDTDEAFIWAPKAKVIFHVGRLDDRFRAQMLESAPDVADVVSHKDYPLLNSLLHLLCYVDAGHITDFENRVPIQAFGIAAILVAAAALRRLASPLIGSAMLVILVSQVPFADAFPRSYADAMVALGLLCATDCFLRQSASTEACWARLGGLSLGFLVWSKHEGALLGLIVAALVLLFARRHAWAWLVPPAAIAALTWAVNFHFGFRNDLVQSGTAEGTIWTRLVAPFSERGALVASWFWRDYASAAAVSRLLLFPLLLAPFHPEVRARRALCAAAVALAAAVVADLWIFAATPRPFEWHWSTAGVRVLSQLNPAIAVVVGGVAGVVLSRRFGVSSG